MKKIELAHEFDTEDDDNESRTQRKLEMVLIDPECKTKQDKR